MYKTRANSRIELEASENVRGTILGDVVDELQSELIRESVQQWRTFKRSNRNKRLIIDLAVKIFDMLIKYKASRTERGDMKAQTAARMDLEKLGKELSPDEQVVIARAIKRLKQIQGQSQ